MLRQKRLLQWGIIGLVILVAILLFCSNTTIQVQAQYWKALPPYNLLWPLWSPIFATDFDPILGYGFTPILNELSASTVLPLQPAVIWDAVLLPKGPPWLLYNVPPAFGGGLTFFQDVYGFMPFPPDYLLDPVTGAPAPITYLPGYSVAYLPAKVKHFELTVDFANLLYSFLYGLTPTEFNTLLTPAQIWGIPFPPI